MNKINTDVIIDDKVYTISSEQDAAYVRQLAAYVNEKLDYMRRQQDYNKQPFGIKQMLLLMNMADEYFRMKELAEVSKENYEKQEAEFYNMKREMVNMQLAMARMKQEHACASTKVTAAQCPYLQSLEAKKEEEIQQEPQDINQEKQNAAEPQERPQSTGTKSPGPKPPYQEFSVNRR